MKDEDLQKDSKITELEVRLRDTEKQLTETRKERALLGVLSETLAGILPKLGTHKPLPIKAVTKDAIDETALLVISDIHGDQTIAPKRVQNLESYNFNAACHRAARIADTTISHLRENLTLYKFKEVVVMMAGDLVSGEIHRATQHSAWQNSFKNALGVGEMLAFMFIDMLKYFNLRVISVSGNHGRRSIKKDYRGSHDNWDYLVMMHVRTRLQNYIDEGRLTIELPEAYTVGVQIEGWNFILNHYDDIKSYQQIPWYGIERKTRRLAALGGLTGVTPHYFVGGHFHNFATQQHTLGEVIINGKWPATDEYALESLGACGEPFQMLAGVHKKHGLSWRMPIRIRDRDWKKTEVKPARYQVRLFD